MEDMPEFHEQQRIAGANTSRAMRLAQQHGVSLKGAELLQQRLEAFIDWIMPDDSEDDDVLKARVRFELHWAQTVSGSLDGLEKAVRQQSLNPIGVGRKPSGLIVPGR
jgi:hypothetical protein